MSPLQQAEAAGFDLSLVDESLRLSPEQRLLQHQQSLELVLAVEQAGKDMRERTQRPVAAA
ncbi:MAG: hypothetical protein ABI645_04485 [Pseudomonadota bacterium]